MSLILMNEWLAGDYESGWDIHWLFFGTFWKPEDFAGISFGLFGLYVEFCFDLSRGV